MHSSMRGLLLSWGGSCYLFIYLIGRVGMALVLAKRGKRLRKLFLYAFFGPFGRREIGEPLRIAKVWIKHLKVCRRWLLVFAYSHLLSFCYVIYAVYTFNF